MHAPAAQSSGSKLPRHGGGVRLGLCVWMRVGRVSRFRAICLREFLNKGGKTLIKGGLYAKTIMLARNTRVLLTVHEVR